MKSYYVPSQSCFSFATAFSNQAFMRCILLLKHTHTIVKWSWENWSASAGGKEDQPNSQPKKAKEKPWKAAKKASKAMLNSAQPTEQIAQDGQIQLLNSEAPTPVPAAVPVQLTLTTAHGPLAPGGQSDV